MSSKNRERMLDKKTYLPKTLSTYQVIGAYLVDIYYNHLYNEGIKFKDSGKFETITDGYRYAIYVFIQTIDVKSPSYKPKYYTQLLIGINEFFTIHTSFSTLSLTDCIDKITKEFIPDDYYSSLDKDQKRNILRGVLTNVIKEFSKYIVSETINFIIDNHSDVSNVELLKDKLVDLFIIEREAMYMKFLDNDNITNDKMDRNIGKKLEFELKKVIKEKSQLQLKISELEKFKQKWIYTIAGGAIVLSWVTAHADTVLKLLK